jgi:two-component system, NtrC family, sensor kinase
VTRSFDPLLVALAYLVAIVAATVAIRLAERAATAAGRAVDGWHLLAAVAAGAGIWTTHFVAARALMLPRTVADGTAETVAALAAAIVLGGIAFGLAARGRRTAARIAAASVAVVAAVAAVARLSVGSAATATYDVPLLFVVLAVGAAATFAALRVAAHARRPGTARAGRQRFVAAVVLGVAVAGVDFGVAAASSLVDAAPGQAPAQSYAAFWPAAAVACGTTLLLAVAMLVGDALSERRPGTPRVSLRLKIAGAFLLATLLAGGLVVGAVRGQFAEAESAALYEALHMARAIAIAGGPDAVRDPQTLRRYLAQLHERDERTVYALDPAQRVLASFDPTLVGATIADAPADTIARVLADGVRRPARSSDPAGAGERLLVTPLRAQPTDASSAIVGVLVVEYTDFHDLLVAGARDAAERLAAIGLAVVLLIALLGSRVAAAIARPIADMERAAARLAQGDYDVQAPAHGRDEIAALGTAFNAMARELRANHARLLADQRELEARVAERTAAWQAAASAHREAADELRTIVDHLPLALAYVGRDLVVHYHNARFEAWTACPADGIDGHRASEVLGTENFALVEPYVARVLAGEEVSYERPNVARDGTRQFVAASLVPRRADDGTVEGFYSMVQDVTARQRATEALQQGSAHLSEVNQRLQQAQDQLLQVEKMASIGQLASGVAHEINNPIGYVYSNLGTLDKYLDGILDLLERYARAEAHIGDAATLAALREAKAAADIDFVKRDLVALLAESREGITRVKKIVQDLKNFSRTASDEAWQQADLHAGLESTLNIVWNELKYKADVVRSFGTLPPVECRPSQLNQVFMNLLVNAAQAIRDRGTIRIATGTEGDRAWVEIADDGQGIRPEHLSRVFDPFFTTKAVGQGTGLGLSLSYRIVDEHHGRIEVASEPGAGTRFRVWLPIRQPQAGAG